MGRSPLYVRSRTGATTPFLTRVGWKKIFFLPRVEVVSKAVGRKWESEGEERGIARFLGRASSRIAFFLAYWEKIYAIKFFPFFSQRHKPYNLFPFFALLLVYCSQNLREPLLFIFHATAKQLRRSFYWRYLYQYFILFNTYLSKIYLKKNSDF